MYRKLTVGSLRSLSSSEKSGIVTEQSPHSRKPVTRMKPVAIRLLQNGRFVDVSYTPGENLLEAALAELLPLAYKCKKGACGRCQVQVVRSLHLLEEANVLERKLLSDLVDSGIRLACQACMKKSDS